MSSKKTDQLRKRAEELYKRIKESPDGNKYADDLEHWIKELNIYQIALDLQQEAKIKPDIVRRIDPISFQAKMLESIEEAVIVSDPEGKVIYWSKSAERLYGWTAMEAIGQNIVELTPSKTSKSQAKAIMSALSKGKSWSGEFKVKDKNKREFIVNVSDTPVLDEKGTLKAIIGVSKDVSNKVAKEELIRKQNQRLEEQNKEFQVVNEKLKQTNQELEDLNQKLLRSEEKYRHLFEESTDPSLLIQGDSFVQANKSALDFLGMQDESEIIGKKPWEISPARQADGVLSKKKASSMIHQAIRKGYHRFEWIHIDKNKEERWIDVSLTYLPGTSPKSLHTIWRDITEQKEAHRIIQNMNEEIATQNEELRVQYEELAEHIVQIRKSNKELKTLNRAIDREKKRAQNYLDVAEVMMIALDKDGKLNLVNNKALSVLGYKENEVIGKSWFDHFLPEGNIEDVKKIFSSIIEGEFDQLEYVENHVISKNGGERMIAWHNALLKDDNGKITGTLSSGTDITDQWMAEQALDKSKEELTAIFEMSLHLICIADINTMSFTRINPAFTHVLGFGEDELLGRSFLDFIHPDDIKPTKTVVERELKKGKKVIHFVNRYRKKNGDYAWLDWVSHPVPDLGITYAIATDITEQRQSESALQESEYKYRSLFDNIQEGVALHEMIFDKEENPLDFIFLDVNPTYEKITHLKKKEIVGRRGTEVLPELEQKWLDLYGKVTKTGRSVSVTDHSEYLDKYWEVKAFRPAEGKFAIAMKDVTENIKAQKLLEESEERLRNIVEHSTNMFYSHNTNNEITYVSPQSDSILGYTPAELKIKWIDLASDNPDNKKAYELTAAAIKTGVPQDTYELELVHKSGKKVLVEVREAPLVENGKTTAIVGALVDITERKQAEKALAESEEMYKTLINASPDAIIFADNNGIIRFISPNLEKVLKAPAKKITGTHLTEWIAPGDIERAKKNVTEIISGHSLGLNDYNMTKHNGEKFIGEVVSSVVKNPGGSVNGMISILRDVTEDVKMHDELKQHREHLAEIVEERTREIEQKSKQLERMNKLFVGREFRIKELREKVKSLENQLKA